MASVSVWKDNKVLKKWIKKNQLKFMDGNFNFDMTNLLSDPLLETISETLNIDKNYIYMGAGSSQLITVIINLRIWNKIIIPSPEFGLYGRNIKQNSSKYDILYCLTTKEFISKLKGIKSTKNDLICLSSPRWFSGERFSDNQIKEILKSFNGSLLIDEAYISFSNNRKGLIDLALKNDRVMILRSLSKDYFISGLRIGYLVTKKKIPGLRDSFIAPHSISTYSARFATELLKEKNLLRVFSASIEQIKENRDMVYNFLKKDENTEIIKSESNFLTLIFKKEDNFTRYYDCLKDLPGIQKFIDGEIYYIKIWIGNKKHSQEIIKRISLLS